MRRAASNHGSSSSDGSRSHVTPGTLRRQAFGQLLAAQRLRLVAGQVHLVAARRQLAHDGLEVPEVREVQRREEDLHPPASRAITRRFLP